MKKEASVEQQLDEFREKYSEQIWEIKPMSEGVGSIGKPDRTLTINGFTIGIEAKRIMSKTNQSTLPTVLQTRELENLIEAGGVGCVIDLNSIDIFLQDLEQMIYKSHDIKWFKNLQNYKKTYCITNWGRYPSVVTL